MVTKPPILSGGHMSALIDLRARVVARVNDSGSDVLALDESGAVLRGVVRHRFCRLTRRTELVRSWVPVPFLSSYLLSRVH